VPVDSPTSTASPLAGAPAWIERSDLIGGPSARQDHSWTVDGANEIAYLFGGLTADGVSNELWAFDLASESWTLLDPVGDRPDARFGQTAAFVPPFGLVVWSGQGTSRFFDDVWAYDPTANAWALQPSSGAIPAARYGSCAAINSTGQMWISHGFTEDSGRFSDTRSYDLGAGEWADRTPGSEVPVKRCLHDCLWSTGDRLVLYGGQTTGVAALGDIWAYDPVGALWSKGPESAAPPRQLYAMASVGATGVVFGGGSLDGGYLDDTWIINSDSLEMTPLDTGPTKPQARSGATLIADPSRHGFLLFGGQNDTGLLSNTWELGPF
jgi:Galactose oxidase, central domain